MLIDFLPDDLGQEDRTAVLVVSCSRFKQVWGPFFTLFERFWPDCPYEVHFAVDTGSHPRAIAHVTGTDIGWGSICLNALRTIPASRVIMFQEDFLIKSKVDTNKVRRFVRHAHDQDIGCLRLGPCPGPTAPWHGTESLGTIEKHDPHKVSLQLAVWKKSVLETLIKDGDSPWQVEGQGPQRVLAVKEPFVSVWRESENVPGGPVPYIITAVVHDVWQQDAFDLMAREGIPMDGITRVIPR